MTTSEIVHGPGGSMYAGPDAVNLVRAVHLKAALSMYAKTKMLMTRGATPTMLLVMAREYTGKTYKGANKYHDAAEGVQVWIDTMRAALPVTVIHKGGTVKRDLLAPIKMTTGGERTHRIVIDEGVVKEWIGFGWIELHEADQSDLDQYPSVVD